jgi:hypothetical protein
MRGVAKAKPAVDQPEERFGWEAKLTVVLPSVPLRQLYVVPDKECEMPLGIGCADVEPKGLPLWLADTLSEGSEGVDQ